MARRKQKWHGWRGLLNKPGFHSTGAIVAEVEDTTHWQEGKDGNGERLRWALHPNYTLQISDCQRAVVMDLNFGDAESHANNLHKVDTMIKALARFREGLAIEQKLMLERQKWIDNYNPDSL